MNFNAYKMDGLGNDFLIIDNRSQNISLSDDQIKKLADRKNNIGFDQVIYIHKGHDFPDVKYFNSDGKPASACGNGNRCVAEILMNEKGNDKVEFRVGNKIHTAKKNNQKLISVDMGQATYDLKKIPVSSEVKTNPIKLNISDRNLEGYLINVGNPHIIFFEKIKNEDLAKLGPKIENHDFFPDRINVTFAEIIDKKNIRANVWERGAGQTLACGTAACAVAHVAIDQKLSENPVDIHFKMGALTIQLDQSKNIIMTGPVSTQKEILVKI